jgi:O-antigen ligase
VLRIDRWWAAAILFVNGWNFALPVANGLPVWVTPIQLVHGVFVHEGLLVGYVMFAFLMSAGKIITPPRPAQPIAILIAILGFLTMVSAATNFRPLTEVVGSGRYFVLVGYFLAAIWWTRRYGRTFVLRNFLVGLVVSGAINLYYTFSVPEQWVGGLPRLLGQNGPGGHLALGVILSAWLMLERRSRLDAIIAVVTLVVGVFVASISFSKLAMLMAACGVIGWLCVFWRDLNTPRMRRWYAIVTIALAALVTVKRDRLITYFNDVYYFIELKFVNLDPRSVNARFQYFLITAEIVAEHPMFGVGYGGFYDATVKTDAYRKSWRSTDEDAAVGAKGDSNPHSSFLYYAAASGVPGLVCVLTLFGVSLIKLKHGLRDQGISGIGLWGCLAAGYLLFGLTLPTLFNTAVLYLPVAVGIATHSRQSMARFVKLRPAVSEGVPFVTTKQERGTQ